MGGGGGASGATDYPGYVKMTHAEFLYNGSSIDGVIALDAGKDVTSLLNTYITNNPWIGQVAYDGASYVSAMLTGLNSAISNIDAKISEMETYLESLSTTDQIEIEIGQFDVGMRNINMVHSSAFVLGRQMIASSLVKEKLAIKQTILNLYTEKELKIATFKAEFNRIALVAGKEQHDFNIEMDHQEALWAFELYQKAANVLAAACGGTTSTGVKGPSTISTVLGGGLSGAAAGAAIGTAMGGPGIGTAIGAAVGIGAGLLK